MVYEKMKNNYDYYFIVLGEIPKKLSRYLSGFFKESPYHIDISPTLIDLDPAVRITITSGTNTNNSFYLGLVFYILLEDNCTYYKPFGIDSDVRYTEEDVLAFIISTLLNSDH